MGSLSGHASSWRVGAWVTSSILATLVSWAVAAFAPLAMVYGADRILPIWCAPLWPAMQCLFGLAALALCAVAGRAVWHVQLRIVRISTTVILGACALCNIVFVMLGLYFFAVACGAILGLLLNVTW